MNMVQAYYK